MSDDDIMRQKEEDFIAMLVSYDKTMPKAGRGKITAAIIKQLDELSKSEVIGQLDASVITATAVAVSDEDWVAALGVWSMFANQMINKQLEIRRAGIKKTLTVLNDPDSDIISGVSYNVLKSVFIAVEAYWRDKTLDRMTESPLGKLNITIVRSDERWCSLMSEFSQASRQKKAEPWMSPLIISIFSKYNMKTSSLGSSAQPVTREEFKAILEAHLT